jgi:hypothetical protein
MALNKEERWERHNCNHQYSRQPLKNNLCVHWCFNE